MVNQVPWSTAEHRIRAVGADACTGGFLLVEPGTPYLVIERRTWTTGPCITHVQLTYPGEKHELVAEFAPTKP
ncbi:UTRA domain-containing protein [Agrobacterium sp. S2]|nr:UTRA domain-containing protein [Agrobacterium sp. S2]